MRRLVILLLLALAACTSSAPSQVVLWGTVEAAETVETPAERPTYYEHPLAPEAAAEIVVRLDDGSKVTVFNAAEGSFEPGQRVRIVVGSHGAFLL